MKWSYRIVTISGIEVRIHATFLLLLAFFGYNDYQAGGWTEAVHGMAFVLLLFLCVLLHEFGHAFAALGFGIRTPDITLLPIGGLARLERMPSSPWQEFIITVAGPAVNVVIALLLWVVVGLPSPRQIYNFDPESTWSSLLVINITLVIFNLIPAFPMDGGRILRSLLAMKLPHARATLIAGWIGQVFAVLMGIYGLLNGLYLMVFIAIFVFSGAQQEVAFSQIRTAARNLRVGDTMQFHFKTTSALLRVGEIPALLIHSGQDVFALVDDSMHLQGIATREELAEAARTLPSGDLANSVARRMPVLHPETPFQEAMDLMDRISESILPVVNEAGQIVGLLDRHFIEAASRQQPRPA